MACSWSATARRRLLGRPRLSDASPAGPCFRYATQRRRTCRAVSPNIFAALPCRSSRRITRRITSSRSSSRALNVTSPIPPLLPDWTHQTGHFYLAGRGHFHVGSTGARLVIGVPSPRRSYPSRRRQATRPRRRVPHSAAPSAPSLRAAPDGGHVILPGRVLIRSGTTRGRDWWTSGWQPEVLKDLRRHLLLGDER